MDDAIFPPRAKTIAEVITEVAGKHGVTYLEMLSQRRPAALARARQEAYWRCMHETIASLPTIGRHFGNRDHSTILKGAKVYETRMKAATAPPQDRDNSEHAVCENGAA
jgi:chromosomal replication initiator protein